MRPITQRRQQYRRLCRQARQEYRAGEVGAFGLVYGYGMGLVVMALHAVIDTWSQHRTEATTT